MMSELEGQVNNKVINLPMSSTHEIIIDIRGYSLSVEIIEMQIGIGITNINSSIR